MCRKLNDSAVESGSCLGEPGAEKDKIAGVDRSDGLLDQALARGRGRSISRDQGRAQVSGTA